MHQTKIVTNKHIIGIDVAKDKLDIIILPSKEHFIIENNKTQIAKFIKNTLSKFAVRIIVMESTGGYERLAFELFSKANLPVHIAHPNRVFHYGRSKGLFAKTDKCDANMLACYGQDNQLIESKYDAKRYNIKSISNRYIQIKEDLATVRCRLSGAGVADFAKKSLARQEEWLKKELETIERALEFEISSIPELKETREIILSFKGVGKVTANILLSQLSELGSLNKREIAVLSGLAPRNNDSGKKRGVRRVFGGREHIKKALYLCALSAAMHNKKLKLFYQRLIEKGKKPKVALVAVARKIIVILNELIAKKTMWQEDYAKALGV